MPRSEKYLIGPQLLGDIREVIGRVQSEPARLNVAAIETRLQGIQGQAPQSIRNCAWTGTWVRGQTNTITVTTSTVSGGATAVAVNDYFGWKDTGSYGTGLALKQDGTWRLRTIDLETVQGYTNVSTITAPGYMLLGMELVQDEPPVGGEPPSGSPPVNTFLRWFEVTACATQA